MNDSDRYKIGSWYRMTIVFGLWCLLLSFPIHTGAAEETATLSGNAILADVTVPQLQGDEDTIGNNTLSGNGISADVTVPQQQGDEDTIGNNTLSGNGISADVTVPQQQGDEDTIGNNTLSGNGISADVTVPQLQGYKDTSGNNTLSENGIAADVTDRLLHGYDFTAENHAISVYFPDFNMTMEEMLSNMIKEGYIFSPADVAGMLLEQAGKEIKAFRNLFLMICLCSVLSALAQNLVGIYENRQALQLGFYMIYLVLALYLLEAFVSCLQLARQSLRLVTEFLNVFLPAYYFTVGISVGPSSSTGFYSLSMMVVYLVEYVFYLVLIPAASIYFLLALSSCAAPGDRMSSLLQMIKKGISLALKTCMTLVGSLGAIRMLILPAADGISYGTAKKFLSALPGIGNVNDITVQMVGGSLLLIKNGIGIVIMILLVLLAAVPLLRMLMVAFLLRLGGAVSHMLAGDALSRLTERTSSAVMLLIKITGCGYVLNLLVLGIAAACR